MAKELYVIPLAKLPASCSFNAEICGGVQNGKKANDVWCGITAFLPNLTYWNNFDRRHQHGSAELSTLL